MLKIGLIGLGAIGINHYNVYKKLEGASVVAVADGRPDVQQRLGADDTVRVYPTLAALLDNEQIDVIDICTPTFTHADIAMAAFAHGAHVICEKPMALTSADTQRMIDAADTAGKLLMIGQVVRFARPYEYLKNVIDSGELGRPIHADFKRLGKLPAYSYQSWMRTREKSGGTLYDYSIHDLDFAQYAFGMPRAVSCVNHPLRDERDYVVSQLIYDDLLVTVTGGFYGCDLPTVNDYLVVFEHGYVQYRGYKLVKNGQQIDLSAFGQLNRDGLQKELACFVNCAETGIPPATVPAASAQDTIKLIESLLDHAVEI